MSQSEFDRFAKNYDATLAGAMPGVEEDKAYYAEYKIAHIARQVKTRPRKILDFGCGTGRSFPFLKKYFPESELWGFDLSEDCLQTAGGQGIEVKLDSDWSTPGMSDFDLILAANVFHHIPPPERQSAMSRCREALGEKGSLYLFEHNPWNPLTRWVFERCPFDVDAEMLSLNQALQLADTSKLRRISHGYTLFFPQSLAYLHALERFLVRLPLGAQYYVQMAR